MSTKIYEGYRLAEGTDIWDFTERLREQGNLERDRLDLDVIEKFADGVIAKRAEDGKEAPATEEARLMCGYFGWSELMGELGESRLGDPHQLSVTFIKDVVTGRICCLLYAGSKIEHVFKGQPEVEFFGYWNNSDPDENCTPEEWMEREETWERIMGIDPPVRRGISFDLRADSTDGIVEMIYRGKGWS